MKELELTIDEIKLYQHPNKPWYCLEIRTAFMEANLQPGLYSAITDPHYGVSYILCLPESVGGLIRDNPKTIVWVKNTITEQSNDWSFAITFSFMVYDLAIATQIKLSI